MKTTPAYNLNVVVRETGIKPDSLRAWERRYELPQPSRTEGGHRLYSDRDIATVRWLNERLDEGLRIKQAVNLWKEMESSGQDPLLVRPVGTQPAEVQQPLIGAGPTLEEMRTGWVNACMSFDETSAENITNYAFARYPIETVCFEILLGGLAVIGAAWYQGEASVQQEHFASSLVIRRLDALIAASPPPFKPGAIMVSCPSGDDHTIAPLMLTLVLRQRGWRVVYLGADVPKARIEETIQSIKPRIVVMTAQHLKSAASLLEMADILSQKEVRVAFGGLIFNRNPELPAGIPGFYLGEQLKGAIHNLEEILTKAPPIPEVPQRSTIYQDSLVYYLEMQSKIETEVAGYLKQHNIHIEYLTVANRFLCENIEAALRIGNLDLLKPEFNWIEELIRNYQIKPETLRYYMTAYTTATKSLMDLRGELIIRWLNLLVENSNF